MSCSRILLTVRESFMWSSTWWSWCKLRGNVKLIVVVGLDSWIQGYACLYSVGGFAMTFKRGRGVFLTFFQILEFRFNCFSLLSLRFDLIPSWHSVSPAFPWDFYFAPLPSAQCISDLRFPLLIVPVWRLLFLGVTKSPVSRSFNLSQSALFGIHRVLFISFPFLHGSSIEPSFRDFVSEHPCMKSSVLAIVHLRVLCARPRRQAWHHETLGLDINLGIFELQYIPWW